MGRSKKRALSFDEAVEFLNHIIVEKPIIPFLIPLILLAWAIERWVFSFSNWVPLAVAVWATIQVASSIVLLCFHVFFFFFFSPKN